MYSTRNYRKPGQASVICHLREIKRSQKKLSFSRKQDIDTKSNQKRNNERQKENINSAPKEWHSNNSITIQIFEQDYPKPLCPVAKKTKQNKRTQNIQFSKGKPTPNSMKIPSLTFKAHHFPGNQKQDNKNQRNQREKRETDLKNQDFRIKLKSTIG